jgi:hypothetical protein
VAMTIQQAKNREFEHVVVIWPYTITNDHEQKRSYCTTPLRVPSGVVSFWCRRSNCLTHRHLSHDKRAREVGRSIWQQQAARSLSYGRSEETCCLEAPRRSGAPARRSRVTGLSFPRVLDQERRASYADGGPQSLRWEPPRERIGSG